MADVVREVYAKFSVSSGALCYGLLHNIVAGASIPVQGFPEARPLYGGTVVSHALDYNVPAQNGTWNAFHLVRVGIRGGKAGDVCGWLISHADVDPCQEIDKLLRVSGSPYEFDSGNQFNNNETKASGVFVINRYDWAYDTNNLDEIVKAVQEGDGVEDGEYDWLATGNSIGLVDYSQAKAQIREWAEQRPSQRSPSKDGVWMYIPYGEYMFGRFGFNEENTAARSFLFFSARTDFTSTTLKGLQQTLRKEETHEERFERHLREGVDFSGLRQLQKRATPPADPTVKMMYRLPPPESECLGPYDPSEHIFQAEDINALLLLMRELQPNEVQALQAMNKDIDAFQRDRKICGFIDPWKEPVYDLLNELVLSYLERVAIPHARSTSLTAEVLFPDHANQKSIDSHLYPFFVQPYAKPVPGLDANFAQGRLKQFLANRSKNLHSGDGSLALSDDSIAGFCRIAAYLVSEVLHSSNRFALGSWSTKIVPSDIRFAVHTDQQLFEILQYSVVMWKGRY